MLVTEGYALTVTGHSETDWVTVTVEVPVTASLRAHADSEASCLSLCPPGQIESGPGFCVVAPGELEPGPGHLDTGQRAAVVILSLDCAARAVPVGQWP